MNETTRVTNYTVEEDALQDEMDDAFWGAYRAAPSGEGVMGAADFGCRAVVLVARGMKAPEAVAKAIGDRGNYGVPRRHALVPLEPTPEMVRAAWDEGGLSTGGGVTADEHMAAKVWRAMVDATENPDV